MVNVLVASRRNERPPKWYSKSDPRNAPSKCPMCLSFKHRISLNVFPMHAPPKCPMCPSLQHQISLNAQCASKMSHVPLLQHHISPNGKMRVQNAPCVPGVYLVQHTISPTCPNVSPKYLVCPSPSTKFLQNAMGQMCHQNVPCSNPIIIQPTRLQHSNIPLCPKNVP